jgi:predicted double-glycine peptidase
MILWLETGGILLIAAAGVVLGTWASLTSTRARLFAMTTAFAVVGLILLARQSSLWELFPFLCPIAASRLRFTLLAFAVTLGLTAPLVQLRSFISRFVTCVIMSVFITILVSLPFLGPAMIQRDLSAVQTRFDMDGVCRQTQPFTCGPAAAVTALNRLGVQAAEGELALQSRTSPIIGTSPWNLYQTLKTNYKSEGIECSFLHLSSIDQLAPDAILLAVVRDAPTTDHCVAVLGVGENTVTVADPVAGLVYIPRDSFNHLWRNCGILLHRPL